MFEDLPNKPYYVFLLAILGGVGLSLGTWWSPLVLFVAFLPLLEIDIHLKHKNASGTYLYFFIYIFIALLIWNAVFATVNLSLPWQEVWLQILLSTLFQTLVFILFRITRDAINEAYGYFSWVLYWLSLEYVLLVTGFPEVGLILGNAFAKSTYLVQWYEVTGVLGGSMWILSINVFLYLAIRSKFSVNRKVFGIYVCMILAIAYVVSLYFKNEDLARTPTGEMSISTSEIRNIKTCASQELFRGSLLASQVKAFICAHKQNASLSADYFLDQAKLRAIENRCFALVLIEDSQLGLINPAGEFLKNVPKASELQVRAKSRTTFYAKQGDYLGRLAVFLAIGLFLTGLIRHRIGPKDKTSVPLK